ncbi:MAG: class I SAM-dependent methyltransferase [Hadesarchaea archaeon]|nr:class I SAM-dependent methyltransferase [Hadesarchaea archaeon]
MSASNVVKENLRLHRREAKDYESDKVEIYNEREQERINSVLSEVKNYIKTNNSELRALDVGCGTGNMLEKLIPRFNEVIGVDISDEMLSKAKKKQENNGSDSQLVRGKAAKLPFPDNHFDVVTTYSVLHHLPDFSEPISEISRVLKDGGVLYIDHEPVDREKLAVKSYIKFCDMLNGEHPEGLPPYAEMDGRELCDYHLHHGEECGIPTSRVIELCENAGLNVINTRKYLSYGTRKKNPLHSVLKLFVDSEWMLIGRKNSEKQ